jgi:hypothetical protein
VLALVAAYTCTLHMQQHTHTHPDTWWRQHTVAHTPAALAGIVHIAIQLTPGFELCVLLQACACALVGGLRAACVLGGGL